MDQDIALAAIRDIVEGPQPQTGDDHTDPYCRLIELVAGLDQWISRGGALPRAWQHHSYIRMTEKE